MHQRDGRTDRQRDKIGKYRLCMQCMLSRDKKIIDAAPLAWSITSDERTHQCYRVFSARTGNDAGAMTSRMDNCPAGRLGPPTSPASAHQLYLYNNSPFRISQGRSIAFKFGTLTFALRDFPRLMHPLSCSLFSRHKFQP